MSYVIAHEQIEVTVSVIVQEGSPCIPTFFSLQEAGFARDFRESAVAIVMVKHVLAVIGDEQVKIPVVIVVPHANALTPAVSYHPGLSGHVGEGPVVVVPVKAIGGFR